MTKRVKVGVLRGGKGPLYDISLSSGAHVLKNLPDEYEGLDVLVTKDGVWHLHGVPSTPERIARHVAVVFNALHGTYGEDGKVQHILESLDIPYTGSTGFPSMLSHNKHLSRNHFKKHGFKIPRGTVVHRNDDIENAVRYIFNTTPPPWIIKPTRGGTSLGVSYADSYPELIRGVEEGLEYGDSVIVEEYIKGKEVTSGVVEGEDGIVHVLPAVMVEKDSHIFDFASKQNTSHFSGSDKLSPEEHWMVKNAAGQAHKKLGLRHYSRGDFIIHPRRGVYLLEVNSLPALHRGSVFHRALRNAGTSFKDFLGHVLGLARKPL